MRRPAVTGEEVEVRAPPRFRWRRVNPNRSNANGRRRAIGCCTVDGRAGLDSTRRRTGRGARRSAPLVPTTEASSDESDEGPSPTRRQAGALRSDRTSQLPVR